MSTVGISALVVTSAGRIEGSSTVISASWKRSPWPEWSSRASRRESSLPDHLTQYFAEEPDLAVVSLETVLRAAGRILDIANGWGPRWKSGDQKPTKSR